jgi:hypothetical protein
MSTGAIVGIVIAAVFLVLVLSAIVIPLMAHERNQTQLGSGVANSTCEDVAASAVTFSDDVELAGSPLLVSVDDAAMLEDDRASVDLPSSGYALVMSCTGTGAWADGRAAPIVMQLLVDPSGHLFVTYYVSG